MKFRRASVAAVATAGMILGTAAPALASYYYSASNPLRAMQDGASQAEMYGRFYKENLTYLRNSTWQRDPKPGGDAVYEETFYSQFYSTVSGQPAAWQSDGVDSGPKTTSGSWYSQYDHQQIKTNAEKGRMSTNVCEDHGIFAKDPCSPQPVETFDY